MEDIATHQVLLGMRDYDPGQGRFTSIDPLLDPADPSVWNPYVYGGWDPVGRPDPSGLAADPGWDQPGSGVWSPVPGGGSGGSAPGSGSSTPKPAPPAQDLDTGGNWWKKATQGIRDVVSKALQPGPNKSNWDHLKDTGRGFLYQLSDMYESLGRLPGGQMLTPLAPETWAGIKNWAGDGMYDDPDFNRGRIVFEAAGMIAPGGAGAKGVSTGTRALSKAGAVAKHLPAEEMIRMRHYTSASSARKIQESGLLRPGDRGRVWMVPARRKPMSPHAAQDAFKIKPGHARRVVEFDVPRSRLERKIGLSGGEEWAVKGVVPLVNPKWVR